MKENSREQQLKDIGFKWVENSRFKELRYETDWAYDITIDGYEEDKVHMYHHITEGDKLTLHEGPFNLEDIQETIEEVLKENAEHKAEYEENEKKQLGPEDYDMILVPYRERVVGEEYYIETSWGMSPGIYPEVLKLDTLTGMEVQMLGVEETSKRTPLYKMKEKKVYSWIPCCASCTKGGEEAMCTGTQGFTFFDIAEWEPGTGTLDTTPGTGANK